jgi:hypothetical protein
MSEVGVTTGTGAVVFKITGMEEFFLCPFPRTFDNLVLALASIFVNGVVAM